MQARINSSGVKEKFVYDLIDTIIKPTIIELSKSKLLDRYSAEFNIDAPVAFRKLASNIAVNKDKNEYVITFSSHRYDENNTYVALANLFDVGSLSVPRVSSLNKLFRFIDSKANIKLLYNAWLKGKLKLMYSSTVRGMF